MLQICDTEKNKHVYFAFKLRRTLKKLKGNAKQPSNHPEKKRIKVEEKKKKKERKTIVMQGEFH